VPFGDHFQVQVKREIDTLSTNPAKSYVKASVGVAWHKNTEFKKSITKNVHEHMAKEIREMMNISVKEVRARAKKPWRECCWLSSKQCDPDGEDDKVVMPSWDW